MTTQYAYDAKQDSASANGEPVVSIIPWAMRHAWCGIFEIPPGLAFREWLRLTEPHEPLEVDGVIVPARKHAHAHESAAADTVLTPTDNSRSYS